MNFFLHNEKSIKNGLYLDYYFKNFFFYIYKNIVGNSFICLLDKYLVERLFFSIKKMLDYISYTFFLVKNLNFQQILKLFLIIIIQLVIIVIL